MANCIQASLARNSPNTTAQRISSTRTRDFPLGLLRCMADLRIQNRQYSRGRGRPRESVSTIPHCSPGVKRRCPGGVSRHRRRQSRWPPPGRAVSVSSARAHSPVSSSVAGLGHGAHPPAVRGGHHTARFPGRSGGAARSVSSARPTAAAPHTPRQPGRGCPPGRSPAKFPADRRIPGRPGRQTGPGGSRMAAPGSALPARAKPAAVRRATGRGAAPRAASAAGLSSRLRRARFSACSWTVVGQTGPQRGILGSQPRQLTGVVGQHPVPDGVLHPPGHRRQPGHRGGPEPEYRQPRRQGADQRQRCHRQPVPAAPLPAVPLHCQIQSVPHAAVPPATCPDFRPIYASLCGGAGPDAAFILGGSLV